MEVALFGTFALVFVGLFLWLMIAAARPGRLLLAGLLGALAMSTPISMVIPFLLTGGLNALIGVLLLCLLVAGTAALTYRSYRNGHDRTAAGRSALGL